MDPTRWPQTAAALLLCLTGLAACNGGDQTVHLTITPSASLPASLVGKISMLELNLRGADTGSQVFAALPQRPLFANGSERVVFLQRPDAQGNLVVEVIARGADKLPLAVGQAQVPLLVGRGASIEVLLAEPSLCEDGVRDNGESDIDCGASCSMKCPNGKDCDSAADCAEGSCVLGLCAPVSCGDGVSDGEETDLDCGGTCPTCATGKKCVKASDCKTAFCGVDGLCGPCAAQSDCTEDEECLAGSCKKPLSTTRSCTVANGAGTQSFSAGAWSACMAVSCDAEFHLNGAACDANTRTCTVGGGSGTQVWMGTVWGGCVASGCPANKHLENNTCVADTKACLPAPSDGAGTQTWNGVAYATCVVTSCNPGFHLESNSCKSNVKACDPAPSNGTGTQTWIGSAYGSCAITCNSGYHLEAQVCTSDTRSCPITAATNGVGTQTWNGSGYSTCTPTSCITGYHVDGSACVSNTRACRLPPHGNGTETWNGATYVSCTLSSCDSGWHIESQTTCAANVRDCTENVGTVVGAGTQTWMGNDYGACNSVVCGNCFVPTNGDCVAPLCSSAGLVGTLWLSCWPSVATECTSYCATADYYTAHPGASNAECMSYCGDYHRDHFGLSESRCR